MALKELSTINTKPRKLTAFSGTSVRTTYGCKLYRTPVCQDGHNEHTTQVEASAAEALAERFGA